MIKQALVSLGVLALAAGCTATGQSDTPMVEVASAAEAPAEAPVAADLGIVNMRRPAAGLLTAGQLTEDQMKALMAQGYGTFISLRPQGEGDDMGWEEAFADASGTTFVRIPIASAADLSRENATLLASHMEAGGSHGDTVVYCKSGNRVGALLALKAAWVDGVPPEEALEFGRQAGVTRLEPAVEKALGLSP